MLEIFYIILFGTLGVLTRYGIGLLASRNLATEFPVATFSINLVGSFLIGIIYVYGFERTLLNSELRTALMVGFLGGFTTFSAFSLEALNLIQAGRYLYATIYIGLSPLLGVAFAFMGMALARKVAN